MFGFEKSNRWLTVHHMFLGFFEAEVFMLIPIMSSTQVLMIFLSAKEILTTNGFG